ncbi:MAG: hypothetical protein RDV41_02530 [Planctomycetota bacterium]|nr:hypothetical protein [Planctomycetota bacterium]
MSRLLSASCCAVVLALFGVGCRATDSSRLYTDTVVDNLRLEVDERLARLERDVVSSKRILEGLGGTREELGKAREEVKGLQRVVTEGWLESKADLDRVIQELLIMRASAERLNARVAALEKATGDGETREK